MKKEIKKCQDCGEKREDVKDTLCPFALDMFDECRNVTICSDCYQDRCDDI